MRVFVIAAAVWLAAGAAVRADAPALEDLRVTREGEDYAASCRLTGGLTGEILEEIDSGLETTIAFRLTVHRRRDGLPDPIVVKRRVRSTVRHDALTRQYTLTRRIDDELHETKVTSDASVMREFLTRLDRVPLARVDELVSGHEYYLKAKSDLGLVWRFYLIPWRLDTASVQVPIDTVTVHGADARP